MYKIALICEHGASTGMCVRKMIESSKELGIECEIAAFSSSSLDNIVDEKDCILLGPQLAFKLSSFEKAHPEYAYKLAVINAMDFGMMDGKKILNDAIELIKKS